jgi:hypothetical protein
MMHITHSVGCVMMHQTAANKNTALQRPRDDTPDTPMEIKRPAEALKGTGSSTHHSAGCGQA